MPRGGSDVDTGDSSSQDAGEASPAPFAVGGRKGEADSSALPAAGRFRARAAPPPAVGDLLRALRRGDREGAERAADVALGLGVGGAPSALHHVALRGDAEAVSMLLARKADISRRADLAELVDGRRSCRSQWVTPLEVAALNGHGDIVMSLLSAGATPADSDSMVLREVLRHEGPWVSAYLESLLQDYRPWAAEDCYMFEDFVTLETTSSEPDGPRDDLSLDEVVVAGRRNAARRPGGDAPGKAPRAPAFDAPPRRSLLLSRRRDLPFWRRLLGCAPRRVRAKVARCTAANACSLEIVRALRDTRDCDARSTSTAQAILQHTWCSVRVAHACDVLVHLALLAGLCAVVVEMWRTGEAPIWSLGVMGYAAAKGVLEELAELVDEAYDFRVQARSVGDPGLFCCDLLAGALRQLRSWRALVRLSCVALDVAGFLVLYWFRAVVLWQQVALTATCAAHWARVLWVLRGFDLVGPWLLPMLYAMRWLPPFLLLLIVPYGALATTLLIAGIGAADDWPLVAAMVEAVRLGTLGRLGLDELTGGHAMGAQLDEVRFGGQPGFGLAHGAFIFAVLAVGTLMAGLLVAVLSVGFGRSESDASELFLRHRAALIVSYRAGPWMLLTRCCSVHRDRCLWVSMKAGAPHRRPGVAGGGGGAPCALEDRRRDKEDLLRGLRAEVREMLEAQASAFAQRVVGEHDVQHGRMQRIVDTGFERYQTTWRTLGESQEELAEEVRSHISTMAQQHRELQKSLEDMREQHRVMHTSMEQSRGKLQDIVHESVLKNLETQLGSIRDEIAERLEVCDERFHERYEKGQEKTAEILTDRFVALEASQKNLQLSLEGEHCKFRKDLAVQLETVVLRHDELRDLVLSRSREEVPVGAAVVAARAQAASPEACARSGRHQSPRQPRSPSQAGADRQEASFAKCPQEPAQPQQPQPQRGGDEKEHAPHPPSSKQAAPLPPSRQVSAQAAPQPSQPQWRQPGGRPNSSTEPSPEPPAQGTPERSGDEAADHAEVGNRAAHAVMPVGASTSQEPQQPRPRPPEHPRPASWSPPRFGREQHMHPRRACDWPSAAKEAEAWQQRSSSDPPKRQSHRECEGDAKWPLPDFGWREQQRHSESAERRKKGEVAKLDRVDRPPPTEPTASSWNLGVSRLHGQTSAPQPPAPSSSQEQDGAAQAKLLQPQPPDEPPKRPQPRCLVAQPHSQQQLGSGLGVVVRSMANEPGPAAQAGDAGACGAKASAWASASASGATHKAAAGCERAAAQAKADDAGASGSDASRMAAIAGKTFAATFAAVAGAPARLQEEAAASEAVLEEAAAAFESEDSELMVEPIVRDTSVVSFGQPTSHPEAPEALSQPRAKTSPCDPKAAATSSEAPPSERDTVPRKACAALAALSSRTLKGET